MLLHFVIFEFQLIPSIYMSLFYGAKNILCYVTYVYKIIIKWNEIFFDIPSSVRARTSEAWCGDVEVIRLKAGPRRMHPHRRCSYSKCSETHSMGWQYAIHSCAQILEPLHNSIFLFVVSMCRPQHALAIAKQSYRTVAVCIHWTNAFIGEVLEWRGFYN